MKNQKIAVMVTGVGSASVGNQILKSLNLKPKYRTVSTDIVKESMGFRISDKSYIVPKSSKKKFLKEILKICKKEKIKFILPGSESELLVLSKRKNFFKDHGIIIISNPHKIVKLCLDKGKLFDFLKSKNVNVPEFQVVKDIKEFKNCKIPAIVKPVKGSGSKSVFLAETLDEVKFFIKYLTLRGHKIIVQEYVGNGDNEFTVGVIRLHNGKIKVSIALKRDLRRAISCKEDLKSKNNNKRFQISTGISQGWFNDFKKIRIECEKIADILDADGPINIQCRKIKDMVIPFEINPRFSGTTFLRSMVGFNEPDMIIKYYLYDKTPLQPKIPKKYVSRDLFEEILN